MSEKHLTVSIEDEGNNPSIFLEMEGYGTLAQMGGGLLSDRKVNSRRLAAAWNACAGISTAALEAGAVADLLAVCKAVVAYAETSLNCGICAHEFDDHEEGCPYPEAVAAIARATASPT